MLFLFTLLIILSLFFRRISGYEDPLIRKTYLLSAGISFLLIGDLPRNSDYYTVLYSLLFTYLVVFFSNPKSSPPKSIKKSTLYVLISASTLGLIFSVLDVYFNLDLSKSVYTMGSFDFRGDLKIPALRFASATLSELAFPALILTKKFNIKFFNKLFLFWIIINILTSLSAPGKSLVFNFLNLFLDWLFWSKVLSSERITFKPIININSLFLNKKFFKQFVSLVSIVLIVIVSTLFAIQSFIGLDFLQSIELLYFRLFNASYDLAFKIIATDSVNLDLTNLPANEFPNIIQLWLKPIYKNLLGIEYKFDTIPKYVDYLITQGAGKYGISSPNSNLFLETTILHGRITGLFIMSSIVVFGSYVRRKFLSLRIIDTKFICFIPIIYKGPVFCFQESLAFFTGYIYCYISIVILFGIIFNFLVRKDFIISNTN